MRNVGLVISVTVHVVVLGWGMLTLTSSHLAEPQETVFIPIEMVEIADTASAQKGDLAAPMGETPAPKPVERPTENENAQNVGEGNLDTQMPFNPKEKNRDIETAVPDKGKPDETPPIAEQPVIEPQKPQEQPAPAPEPKPEPAPEPKPEPAPSEVPAPVTPPAPVIPPAPVTPPTPALPTSNAPTPQMKPQTPPQARPQTTTLGEESVETLLAQQDKEINRTQTQGGASRGSTAPAALGADKDVGDKQLKNSLNNIIGSCVKRNWNLAALNGGTAYDLKVWLEMNLDQNGNIVGAPKLTATGGDEAGREIIINQSRTAVFSCAPYRGLPADKYQQWRVVNINMTPFE